MGRDSAFLTSRNALIATVIALALNPISGIIGYRLSKSLSKPRITIEFVNPVIKHKDIILEQDILSDIRVHKNAFDKITGYYLLETWEKSQNPDLAHNFLKEMLGVGVSASVLRDGQISFDFIESAMRHKSLILSEYDTKTQLIKDNLETLSSQQVFDSSVLKKVPDFKIEPVEEAGKIGPKAASAVVEKWLEKANQEKIVLERIFSSWSTLLQTGEERSGEISFEVGLLNSGDTDGVIYPEGDLYIGERRLKTIIQNNNYGVIKPHSFSKYLYLIKKDEVPKNDVDYLSGLVSKSIPESYKLVVKTTNGNQSVTNKLPVNEYAVFEYDEVSKIRLGSDRLKGRHSDGALSSAVCPPQADKFSISRVFRTAFAWQGQCV